MANQSTKHTSSTRNTTSSFEVVSSFYGSRTEVGHVREHNEDSLTVMIPSLLLLTAWADMKQAKLLPKLLLIP